eukprot:Sspe_Gene.93877::Locus_66377_Transcript_1_1_Confidence_1.000_Length_692::g.93877::m.93877
MGVDLLPKAQQTVSDVLDHVVKYVHRDLARHDSRFCEFMSEVGAGFKAAGLRDTDLLLKEMWPKGWDESFVDKVLPELRGAWHCVASKRECGTVTIYKWFVQAEGNVKRFVALCSEILCERNVDIANAKHLLQTLPMER